MVAGHNSLKRITHRIYEELRATRAIAAQTSWSDALETFRAKCDIQVMNRNGFKEPPAVRDRLIRKHEIMLDYFEKRYGAFYRNYDYDAPLPPADPDMTGRIWLCWWQGIENAPEIVKRCVESIQRNAGDHEVTIITEKNVEQYVKFPQWVKDKRSRGVMSLTHYSDLLRLCLLADYGGTWLDATFLCTGDLEQIAFGKPVFSIKRPGYLHCSVAQGYFANYSLGCDKTNRWIFRALRDFYLHYWQNNDYLIDYLLTDYLIVLAQRHDSRIAEAFAAIKPNNPRCDDLWIKLGDKFDENEWQTLKAHTSLFKLTWKQEYPKTVNNETTYYGVLLNGNLK
ncbi:capsular polysaccharide synthesis protein [Bifidobacterium oedipodis]|uniref:Polysaccharide biosynthesis protein n=1 Tax=Bifidobacterium oedipodis TaxID=2675322 RepID=A0A7Y0ERS3_9BIFI|nr:capsular polysaccharide synthesis protein [Bifidobacterium sp. DSM 109957]NMM95230.1 polysaccharide biosynthesis protein [Bifidobacterium sp. DSM 109957]